MYVKRLFSSSSLFLSSCAPVSVYTTEGMWMNPTNDLAPEIACKSVNPFCREDVLVCPLPGTAGEGVKLQDREGLGYFQLLSTHFKSFRTDRTREKNGIKGFI